MLQFYENYDDVIGIDGFDKITYSKFNTTWVGNTLSNFFFSIEKNNNQVYVVSKIAEIHLLATQKGSFNFGPSEFNYFIAKNCLYSYEKTENIDDTWFNNILEQGIKLQAKSNRNSIK